MSSIEEVSPAESCLVENDWERLEKLPSFLPHEYITSLYLRPYPQGQKTFATIIDLAIVHSICDIISMVFPTLKRLVIDIDTEKVAYPKDDPLNIINVLRLVFKQCHEMEYFCSMQDSFYLQTWGGTVNGFVEDADRDPLVWYTWDKLKTLIVHRAPLDENMLWCGLRRMEALKTVVMVRPIALDDTSIRARWVHSRTEFWRGQEAEGMYGDVDILLVDVEGETILELEYGEMEIEDARNLSIQRVYIPVKRRPKSRVTAIFSCWNDLISHVEADHAMETCQEWVIKKALSYLHPDDW